jgi:hypothetical protein
MSKIQKTITLTLSSLLVIGLMLVGVGNALAADGPFTLVGTLDISGDSPTQVYKVGDQVFVLDPAAVCTNADGQVVTPCSSLGDGALVEVKGTALGSVYTATSVAILSTRTGVLTAIAGNLWTVGGFQYDVSSLPVGSFAVGDVVKLTYKNAAGVLVVVEVQAVATKTYVGKVMGMGATWQVNGESFTVNGDTAVYADPELKDIVEVKYYVDINQIAVEITLYPTTTATAKAIQVDPWMIEGIEGLTTNDWTDDYEGAVPGDIVTVVYYEVDGVVIASEITLFAPIKNENSRCEDWQTADFKIPAGIDKQLPEGVNLAQVYAMFCQGFGWGEIKNAFKLSNPEYTPEELMALKATGKGWGVLKKELDLKPEKENNGKSDENAETSKPGKPDEVGKPDKPEKPENPGNSENAHAKDKDKDKNK